MMSRWGETNTGRKDRAFNDFIFVKDSGRFLDVQLWEFSINQLNSQLRELAYLSFSINLLTEFVKGRKKRL